MKIVKNTRKLTWLLVTAIGISSPAFAAGPPQPGIMQNPLVQALILLMALLALAIAILSNVVNSATHVFRDKLRAQKEADEEKKSSAPVAASLLVVGLMLSIAGFAQDKAAAATAAVTDETINGLSPLTFYMIMIVLAVEIVIIIALVYQLKWLMGIDKYETAAEGAIAELKPVKARTGIVEWWNKLNRSIAIEREKDIDLNHDYDGIRELDNTIPPWWMAAFLFCIFFAGAYLYRYHVAKSAPLQIEELQIAMQKADEEKQAYLKLTASNIDENSVKQLDETGISAGKALFTTNCVACHGVQGQGIVGPNLTDKYWIHGGDIKDVFKTIKYGYAAKGMRSWKEDFTPVQIAQLASFVKSLKGTNPPNGKDPQGTIYEEGAAAKADSSVATK